MINYPIDFTNTFEPKKYVEKRRFGKNEPAKPSFKYKSFLIGTSRLTLHILLPFCLMFSGIIILSTQLIIPTFASGKEDFVSPITVNAFVADDRNVALTGREDFVFEELGAMEEAVVDEEFPKEFYLTIPKLGVERFAVETNSTNLSPDERLGHYKGTCLPGRVCGNRSDSFIFGHSALPAFYDPADPKKVFSKLDDLVVGDKFMIEYEDEILVYRVNFKKVMEPEDLNPLNPPTPQVLGKPTVTLMTCSPAGSTRYRLIVSGELLR